MSRPKDHFDIVDENFNYCITLWEEFTFLTVEEEENFKLILKAMNKSESVIKSNIEPRRKSRCYCIELNKIFNSKTECANFFKTSVANICQVIKGTHKLHSKYTIQEI